MSELNFNCDLCGNHFSDRYPMYGATSYGEGVRLDPNTGEFIALDTMCQSCYSHRNYTEPPRVTCPCCGMTDIHISNLQLMNFEINGTRVMCSQCVRRHSFWCDCCEDRLLHEDITRYITANGLSVCSDCCEANYFTCEECEGIYHTDRMRDEGLCPGCYEDNRTHKIIHDYGYRPMPNFIGGARDRKTLFFGCELEVNVDYDFDIKEKASKVLDLMNEFHEDRVYIKNDSSVGRGFEIVTHPHTYEEACKLWMEKWSESIDGITSHASGNCGFHVHVSRRPLTNMHIQKLVVFINAPENGHLVRTVAQRDCTSYAVLKPNKRIGHCRYSDDRYEAINLENSNTIEFRIFRGNTRKDRILKNLQFVKASIDFTRDRSYRELSASNFCKFISSNKKEFKHLYSFLVHKNFYPGVVVLGEQGDN